MNSGVFLIRPDREEFLFLLNLKKNNKGQTQNDQSWLNDVYKLEKFNIGQEYNVLLGTPEVIKQDEVLSSSDGMTWWAL